MDDAAIHRVLGDANGFISSVIGSQWIATPQEARDDKGGAGGYAGRFLRGQWIATGYALAMTRVS